VLKVKLDCPLVLSVMYMHVHIPLGLLVFPTASDQTLQGGY
jgi:hypothetical protein